MKAFFQDYNVDKYIEENVRYVEPMLAKELKLEDIDKDGENIFTSPDYYIEEKLDGVRAILHFKDGYVRCFSRRVSKQTGWLNENTDSLPHIRALYKPELEGTIIDGELTFPDGEFLDVSSVMNCLWDEAVKRQEDKGYLVFNAFDIMYYKDVLIENMPLYKRKLFLQDVVDTIRSPYIKMLKYYQCDSKIEVDRPKNLDNIDRFADLCNALYYVEDSEPLKLSPMAYYEYIIHEGGEGVVLKNKNGKYLRKRAKEYLKVKKLLTREAIIINFTEPTKEYKGKFPSIEKWNYWERDGKLYDLENVPKDYDSRKSYIGGDISECTPVSKNYCKGWIGNIVLGIVIPEGYLVKPEVQKHTYFTEIDGNLVMCIGECSGFDESMREYLTENEEELIGSVVEVKCNEIFKDTGKMRHPRFFRLRPDKAVKDCTFTDHIK